MINAGGSDSKGGGHGPLPYWLSLQVPFWNGCNEDEHCVPDLVLDARSDLPTAMEYCQQVLRRPAQDCSSYTLSFDTTVFIIESTRRRVAVEATLENRGENAYSAVLNISQSENLQFASLIQKDDSDNSIECVNEEAATQESLQRQLPLLQGQG